MGYLSPKLDKMNFKKMDLQNKHILLCNVWDVPSAQAAEKNNYKAIGTSSGAIASMLGYEDGEEMSFSELEYIVGRIVASVKLPLSVDLEAGYSRDPDEIVSNIQKLVKLGVVGINIEDSLVINGKRELVDAEKFSELLRIICSKIDDSVFINVRTDTFLLACPNPVEQTILRASIYKDAGADGLFVPCIVKASDIKAVIKEINLPLNVMCMPGLPEFQVLEELGVKRISMGNFVFNKMVDQLQIELGKIRNESSFSSLFKGS